MSIAGGSSPGARHGWLVVVAAFIALFCVVHAPHTTSESASDGQAPHAPPPSSPSARATVERVDEAATGERETAQPKGSPSTPSGTTIARPSPTPQPAPPRLACPVKGEVAPLGRQVPRKKLPEVAMDLDGDGRWETLRVKQRQPAPTWRGQDRRKGPRFVVSVHTERDAKEVKVYEADIYGWSQGWAQISVKVATKTSVALLFWSVPEEHETRVSYVHMSGAGKVHLETFKRVPLRVVDLWGDGSEALVTLSQELFQDYFKTGTMQLLRWRKGDTPGFAPVFAKAPFEFCLSLAAPSQVRVLAVDADQRALRLMRASSKTAGALDELDKVAVEPAKSGPPYQVPTGFALSCAPSQRRVQFARHHFAVTERKLRRLPQAKSH